MSDTAAVRRRGDNGRRYFLIEPRRLRPYAFMILIASCLAIAYCLLAISAIASLSGAPNYLGDGRHDALRWEYALSVPGTLMIASIFVLVRTRRRRP